jgi:signal transduction histidine kinase
MAKPTNQVQASDSRGDTEPTDLPEDELKDYLHFSTDMLRRLGEELNPHADQGILELVRNSYDADATECTIELLGTQEKGGTIRITDNGTGMTADEIRNGWLILGTSGKTRITKTKRNRYPIGNKGIGRLSALRLGRTAELITRSAKEPKIENRLLIDWSRFDAATVVDDVALQIEPADRKRGTKNGTTVEIKEIRAKLAKADVHRLARALVLLADPFSEDISGGGGVTNFRPILKVPEFADLERLVAKGYRDEADYHLRAELDTSGLASVIVTDYNNDVLFQGKHKDIASTKGAPPYSSPKANFELWWFVLSSANFTPRAFTLAQVREWLAEFGGVHLYHRGMRVSPYSDFDWLDMNLRRARSPEMRPSTNTSIGKVSVVDEESVLQPKTDRIGFIEDSAFESLRLFATDALDWFADQLLKRREKRRDSEKERTAKKVQRAQKTLAEVMEKVPSESKEKVQQALDEYEKARDDEATTLRKDLQLYRTLGTVGTTTATFAHQAKSPLAHIESSAGTLEEAMLSKQPDLFQIQTMAELAAGIKRDAESLLAFSKVTLGLLQHEKRRRGIVPLHASVKDVVVLLKPYIELRKVNVEQQLLAEEDSVLASRAALECILTNLLINSMKAFEASEPGERTIIIRTRNVRDRDQSFIQLDVIDNGPGIMDIAIEDIWLPGKTTTAGGTGLGLTIVKDVVTEMSGKVAAAANGELGGAEIIITVPIRTRK